MDDAELLVLDPDDRAVTWCALDSRESRPLLTRLIDVSHQALLASPTMQHYLQSVGVPDAAVWSAFRLGVGHASLAVGLEPADWAALDEVGLVHGLHKSLTIARADGLNLPTYDPADPDQVVGVIRLTQAQNKHIFATPPRGIACGADLATHQRIILVDGPLTGLRLAQHGVPGIGIVETPTVLSALIPSLTSHDLVLAGYRRDRMDAMRTALGPLGAAATLLTVFPDIPHTPRDSLEFLGLAHLLDHPDPQPPITAPLLREIVDFARGRLADGCATEALTAMGMQHVDLITAYRIGYCPIDTRTALSRDAQRALSGHRVADCLILPAFDDQGTIVDLVSVDPGPPSYTRATLFDEPLGLLAPELAASAEEVVITDTVRQLGRCFARGLTQTLLMRGAVDAQANAPRLSARGVRRALVCARREGDAIVEALQAVGIAARIGQAEDLGEGQDWGEEPGAMADTPGTGTDEPDEAGPSSSAPEAMPCLTAEPERSPDRSSGVSSSGPDPATDLLFIEEDRTQEVAIFAAGPIRYSIDLRDDGLTHRHVVMRAHAQTHQERFDVAVPAQRMRFAGNASRRTTIPADRIAAQLQALLEAVRRREEQMVQAPTVAIDPRDRAEASAYLEAPDLLSRIQADLCSLGWIGEDQAKSLLYLTALSRMMPQPLWSCYRATVGTTAWQGLGLIFALTPPEEVVAFHRFTETLLSHTDKRALRHRLLVIDQAETLRPEAALALRILHERGGIGWATAGASAITGTSHLLGEARGPVAVLAAAAGDLDHRCRECFMGVRVDESTTQTQRVLLDQRRREGGRGTLNAAQRGRVVALHHACQRLLERRPVVVPFIERVDFPASSVRHRADQSRFLTLIMVSALLHQRQRQRDGDAIRADERDFAIAAQLAAGILGERRDGLGRLARQLVHVIAGAQLTTFTMADLAQILPDWSSPQFRYALQELQAYGYLDSVRGRKRRFELSARAEVFARTGAIALKPVGSDCPVHPTPSVQDTPIIDGGSHADAR
jgi:hypothetical protein